MADRRVALTGKVCTEDHGAPWNAAEVYGHYGSTKTCVRASPSVDRVQGDNPVWVYDVRQARPKRLTKKTREQLRALLSEADSGAMGMAARLAAVEQAIKEN